MSEETKQRVRKKGIVNERVIVISVKEYNDKSLDIAINYGSLKEDFAMGILGYSHDAYIKKRNVTQ